MLSLQQSVRQLTRAFGRGIFGDRVILWATDKIILLMDTFIEKFNTYQEDQENCSREIISSKIKISDHQRLPQLSLLIMPVSCSSIKPTCILQGREREKEKAVSVR